MNRSCLSLAAPLALAAALAVGGCSTSVKLGPEAVAGQTPSATVQMNEVQVAYIGSGSTGGGTLYYQGNSYPFSVSGLGVGGIGASTINAYGEVYNAMASRSVRQAAAICGCRTEPA